MKKPKELKNPKCEVVIDNNLTWIDATPETAKFMWNTYAMERDLNLTPGARRLKRFLLRIAEIGRRSGIPNEDKVIAKCQLCGQKKPKTKKWKFGMCPNCIKNARKVLPILRKHFGCFDEGKSKIIWECDHCEKKYDKEPEKCSKCFCSVFNPCADSRIGAE
jgi:hypothetical protein